MANNDDYFLNQQRFESSFNFSCPMCNFSDIVELAVPEFNFNVERTSDLYSEDSIELMCPECGTEFSGDVACTSASCEISIQEPVEFVMTGDPPMFSADPAAAYDPPPNPHALLTETIERSLIVARMDFNAKNDPQFLKRMAFTTIVTSLEAYLADTLLNKLKSDAKALAGLVSEDRHFSSMKISLSDLVGKPEFVSHFVRRAVQEISFHNLPRTNALYEAAFGIALNFDSGLWGRLNSMMSVRHDCVHRNGHSADGERRDDITLQFVREAAADCRALADHIEDQLFPVPF